MGRDIAIETAQEDHAFIFINAKKILIEEKRSLFVLKRDMDW